MAILRIALVGAYNDRCYGLRCIASYLRREGHRVWLLCFKRFEGVIISPDDGAAWERATGGTYPPMVDVHEEGDMFVPYIAPPTDRECELFLNKLTEIRPDLIGLSVATATYDASRELTQRIRESLPGVPIIWGGIHPTICPEESLQVADIINIGEGEAAMAELVDDPERTDIPGLWRRRNGDVVKGPHRPLEQDLDRLPFASYGEDEWLFEDDQALERTLADRQYFHVMYVSQTQRGCPFLCSYCAHNTVRKMYRGERYVRRRSVDHVLDECEQRVRDFALPSLVFWDDIFIMQRKWLDEFCEKYPKRIGLPFGAYAHPFVSNEEMFRILREAGMVFVGLGIQTGSEYISREVYERRHGSEALLELARAAERNDLLLCCDLLTNNPFESEADCMDTLRLLTQMPKPRSLTVKKVIFYPRTRINEVDKPRRNLSEKTFLFWNQLYLMARHHLIPPEHLMALAQDEHLKANPELVREMALALKRTVEANEASHAEIERLRAGEREVTLRGLLRYARALLMKRLPAPVANGLRALKKRLHLTQSTP